MASVNKAIIIGNLGQDPETRYMPDGSQVCTVSIATTEKWKDKSGDVKEKTDWHRIVFYRKLAEIAAQYLKKGSQVYVEGRLETRKYMDKQGVERYVTQIIADKMKMLGGKPFDSTQKSTSTPTNAGAGGSDDAPEYIDDDIPF